jgi:esterase
MELAYSRWDSSLTGTTNIVLLHGMGGTGAIWRPIAADLERDCRILAPDQRGHGGSQEVPERKFHPLDFGRDVIETMEATGFHPAWVVGHSMGARTACAVAQLRPDRVNGLVLIDLGFIGLAGGGFGESLSKLLKNLPMEFDSRPEARTYLAEHSPDPAISQYLLAVSQLVDPAQPSGRLRFPFDREALLETISSARQISLREWVHDFGRAGFPVLVLRGGESKVWSKSDFEIEKRLAEKYPNIVFEEMPGAGHGLPFEKRREFTERLRRFIESSGSRKP